jgi:hypothetical protein
VTAGKTAFKKKDESKMNTYQKIQTVYKRNPDVCLYGEGYGVKIQTGFEGCVED